MSETAPEPVSAPQGRSSSSPFTRQLGPMPLWGWMGVGLALALAYYLWHKNKASAAASTSAQAGTASGTTDSSLVPQFVNQTYVQGSPPSAPSAPVSGPPVSSTPPAQASQYPAPTGVAATKLSGTSAKINWNYITSATPHPTSYTVAVYQLNGKLAQMFTVNAPDTASGSAQATVSGLHPGYSYNVNVWANGGAKAPQHSTAKLTL
jgi:hypothetical protein